MTFARAAPYQQRFSTCWTPQMATLEKLGLVRSLVRHVLQRRHGVVRPGIPRTFPAGALGPGDLLPDTIWPIGSVGTGAVAVTLTGTRHADGSITAGCRRGRS